MLTRWDATVPHTHKKLSVAVISLAVVDDVYSVESSAYIDTLALLKASGMSLVKIEKSKGPKQLPWGIPYSTWIMLDKEHHLSCVRQISPSPQYSRVCKAITHMFPAPDYDR
jgi:hypothetical protein